jgi:hypothetical protein
MVRFGGLALVLLFPLLSVLQLRDNDGPWRETARRVQPSVLGLRRVTAAGGSPEFATCGVVIQVRPARVVVPGRVDETLRSEHNGVQIEWQPLHTDVHGEFTVLQVDMPVAADRPDASTLLAPAKLAIDPRGTLSNDIEVALVGPKELAEQPLWVGVLSVGAGRNGRLGYFSSFLTPISASTALVANAAVAASQSQIDPKLAGAPFVDASGTVVAILLDRGTRGVHALPLEVVAQALALLQLQVAQ